MLRNFRTTVTEARDDGKLYMIVCCDRCREWHVSPLRRVCNVVVSSVDPSPTLGKTKVGKGSQMCSRLMAIHGTRVVFHDPGVWLASLMVYGQ